MSDEIVIAIIGAISALAVAFFNNIDQLKPYLAQIIDKYLSLNEDLSGNYLIKTPSGRHYLTAVEGGGMGEGANVPIRTNATAIGSNEIFRLIPVKRNEGKFALRTAKGNFVTFVDSGGIDGPNPDRSPLHTDATRALAWENFELIRQSHDKYAIKTPKGYYLTAVDGGGWGESENEYPVHTDATSRGAWETFTLHKNP